jgi:hypothetical protein
VARPLLIGSASREFENVCGEKRELTIMKKFLLGFMAVAAVLLPLSQNAQAHWGYYHRYYGYHQGYWHHRYWHNGYWYGGFWHPAYWGPVVVVAPY